MQRVVAMYDRVFDAPFPYSMGWHPRPSDDSSNDEWIRHAHFFPPLLRSATIRKFQVGFEMLGMPQREYDTRSGGHGLASCPGVSGRTRTNLSAKEVITMSVQVIPVGSREEFEREGYTIFRNVIDAELVNEASRHVDWLLARNPGVRPEQLGTRLVGDDPFWVRLVSDSRLLDVAELFIGADIALFASHYISKPPHDGQPVLWHQDGSYWLLEPMEVVSLWLAIDESTPANGCMRVIPRTQHLDLQALRRREDVANVLRSGMDESLVDESAAVDLILRPGDVSVHHPNVIHGSNANLSPQRRCGLTIRYIPTHTRIKSDGPWPSAFLLRGQAVAGVNEYATLPRYEASRHMTFRGCESWMRNP